MKIWLKRFLIVAALLAAVISVLWFIRTQLREKTPEGLIVASGRIEGREVTVASKIQGRLKSLLADEGDTAKKDQLLVEIESGQLDARYLNAKENASLLKYQVEQSKADVIFSEKNTSASVNAAEAAIGAAKAQLEKAISTMETSKKNLERANSLHMEQLISDSNFDRVKMEYDNNLATVTVAEKELKKAEANLKSAMASRDVVKIKKAQLQSAEANYKAALAKVDEAYANLRETKIYAPLDGTILSRPVEVGEVVNPGTPLYVIVDLNKLYMKVYINEPDIGKIKLGNEARIYVDAFPEKAFNARITKIYQQAEFTPKNVETKEERVKLVFGVELSIENPEGLTKPGMPADAVIRWEEGAPWIKPR